MTNATKKAPAKGLAGTSMKVPAAGAGTFIDGGNKGAAVKAARIHHVVTIGARPAPPKVAPKPRSDAFDAIHSAAAGLFDAGVITKTTMKEFDASCMEAPDLNAQDVKRIRRTAKVSQEVFAHYLGTNKSTVQKWESADNRPSAMAQRLLSIVAKHGLKILA